MAFVEYQLWLNTKGTQSSGIYKHKGDELVSSEELLEWLFYAVMALVVIPLFVAPAGMAASSGRPYWECFHEWLKILKQLLK